MTSRNEILLRRMVRTGTMDVIAEIYVRNGLPFRPIATGNRRIEVGQLSLIKSGMAPQEWEGSKAELPMLELCEVASPVHAIRSQPHGLYMKIVGQRGRLLYIPDIEMEVDTNFALDLAEGAPFARAVRDWRPDGKRRTSTLIVEVKRDDDPRVDDEDYQEKLRLADQVYKHLGWFFATVVSSTGIQVDGIARAAHEVFLDHTAAVTAVDVTRVMDLFDLAAGDSSELPLDRVRATLGGGPLGNAKACAMHVRRIIGIDFAKGLNPNTPVRMIEDGRAIFERRGVT